MTKSTTSTSAEKPSTSRDMTSTINEVPVHYVEHGSGPPVLILHGWMVDHRAMTGVLEPLFEDRPTYRRIYVDLPGMGTTPAPDTVTSSDDMLDIVDGLIDDLIGEEPFLLVGQSHGGYLARAIASRRPDQAAGLALICPLGAEAMAEGADVPEHAVLHRSGNLDGILDESLEGEYAGYLVVQTPETLTNFRDREGPGFADADMTALNRIHQRFELRDDPAAGPVVPAPMLIVTGRQDSIVGYAAAFGWLDRYPRATFAVLDLAGHGLPHEQGGLLAALMSEWLDRVEEHRAEGETGTTA